MSIRLVEFNVWWYFIHCLLERFETCCFEEKPFAVFWGKFIVLSANMSVFNSLIEHKFRAVIMLGPHEAGVWAKHPSLTIPAPSRGEPSRHLGSNYQREGVHPVSIDCWLEWPVGLIHAGHAWSPPGIIFKMTRSLVEFWKSLNHNST